MPYRDLREFLDRLDAEGDLARVSRPVSTEFEISGIQSAATQRVVSEIEARGDLIEVTYSIE